MEHQLVFTAAQTWPFTVATLLLLLIAIVEGIALCVGGSFSTWLEQFAPDPPDGVHGIFNEALGWLQLGRVPVLVLMVLFLAGFAITGFAANMVTQRIFGFWLTPLISVPFAIFTTLPLVRMLGSSLARIIPRDQTYAVSFDSLVGRVATIVTGTARHGYPAQARVDNEHGQALYVMVEPDLEGESFDSGAQVLLVKQLAGSRFACILNPRPDLL